MLAMEPTHTTLPSALSQLFARKLTLEKKLKITDSTRNAITNQQVQRGTNRPSGKSATTRKKRANARKFTSRAGNRQMEWLAATVFVTLSAPCMMNMSAMSRAIQSVDLRQASTPATTNHTSAQIASTITHNAA